MHLFVIGGSGLIGSSLVAKASRRGYRVSYSYVQRPLAVTAQAYRVDVSAQDGALETALARSKPDAVVYCAVATDGTDEGLGNINAEGVTRTLEQLGGARFIYLSTNAVFSGLHGPYCETDIPDAGACETAYRAYGLSKAAGEKRALEYPRSLVVRTSSVDGYDGRGQLSERLRELISHLQTKGRLERFGDRTISPTLVGTLTEALLELLRRDTDAPTTLHIAGSERLSDFAYAAKLARAIGSHTTLVETSCRDVFGPGACLQNTSLDVSLAAKLLTTPLPDVAQQFRHIFGPRLAGLPVSE